MRCWVDLDGIESDAQFVNVIIKAIDEADIFLFMYSKKHAEITDFENDWTIREINYAQSQGKRIIFLNIDKIPLSKWFTMMFGLKQQVDVTSVSAMNKLYGDLNKWLSDEDVNGDNDKEGKSVNGNSEVSYKVRANRACWLYIDDEKMQQLDANKTVKFQLESGVYLRKVVDCEEENVSKEDKITLSEKQVFDDIDLVTLYQKYVKGNTKRNFVIEILEKCRKYLQIFKLIAFACFLSAFVFCIVFLVGSKSPIGSRPEVSLVDTINSSVVDTIVEDTKEQKQLLVSEVKKVQTEVDLSQNTAKEKESVQIQEGESKKEPSISQTKQKKENVVTPKQSKIIMVNGHECVDLGLSVKWATCNVGATKPEEYGTYFAWGAVEPKYDYSWRTYKYGAYEDQLIKYCTLSSYAKDGFTDYKIVLDPEDDAAVVNWGGSWRMPTRAEQDELLDCTWDWTTQNGVNGYKVKGPNGNFIFLPAAGFMYVSSLRHAGSYGLYWSSSLNAVSPNYAYFVGFSSDDVGEDHGSRNDGLSVRPVCQ